MFDRARTCEMTPSIPLRSGGGKPLRVIMEGISIP